MGWYTVYTLVKNLSKSSTETSPSSDRKLPSTHCFASFGSLRVRRSHTRTLCLVGYSFFRMILGDADGSFLLISTSSFISTLARLKSALMFKANSNIRGCFFTISLLNYLCFKSVHISCLILMVLQWDSSSKVQHPGFSPKSTFLRCRTTGFASAN